MKKIELIIENSRRTTNNLDFTSQTGISDEEYLQYANDAQSRIFSRIINKFPDMYQKEKFVQLVHGQEAYDIPSDAHLGVMIQSVFYSFSGNDNDYVILRQGRPNERYSGNFGDPDYYIRQSKQILLQPSPQSGGAKIRITYIRTIPRIDKRQIQVSAVTLDPATNQITSLTIDPTSLTSDLAAQILSEEFITIVDKLGNIQMQAIPVTNVNTTTGQLTLDTFTYQDGETIAVGNWVCLGTYSTNVSELPDVCEKYVRSYMDWKVMKRDSDNGSTEMSQELLAMEDEILESFSTPDQDVDYVTILDPTYIANQLYNW